MARKLLFGLLIIVLVAVPLFAAACEEEVTPPGEEEEEEGPPGEEEEEEGDWWDKFGEPQYGGTLSIWIASNMGQRFDPAEWMSSGRGYMECLFQRDWTLDRSICDFTTEFVDPQYFQNGLAESWEYTDPLTVTVHLRQGVHWQDKPPMNGREFTADDVQYTYDRILGTGSGFTEPNPVFAGALSNVERVVATDTYTVEFKLKNEAFFAIYDVFDGGFFAINMAAPEWIEQSDSTSWENAVGTGPYILSDFSDGSSTTYVKNPNYWGYDTRHPENQLPYIETVKEVVIPELSTAIAALRTGQIDVIESMNTIYWQQAQQIADTNPEIQQGTWPSPGQTVEMRCDTEPFTDIRVRKALQLALDLETIGATHYGGMVSGAPEGLVYPGYTGWTLPYDEWPQELQDEYSYNPTLARELLDEAAADGVFEPNDLGGFDTNIIASTSMEDLDLLEIIQSMFLDIGVDMEIRLMDRAAKEDFARGGKMDQMTYTNTAGSPRPPYWNIFLRTPAGGENYTYNFDPHYEDLSNQFKAAPTMDEAKRLATECDMYALEQHWVVTTFHTVSVVVWQPWVKGNSGEFTIGQLFPFYYSRWWIDQSLK